MLHEASEPITIEECRRCEARPARGVRWVENGIVYWKCDECGKTQHEGVLEEVNREQVEKQEGHDRAITNRDRYMREWGEKIQQDMGRAAESFGDPLTVGEEGISRVMDEIL